MTARPTIDPKLGLSQEQVDDRAFHPDARFVRDVGPGGQMAMSVEGAHNKVGSEWPIFPERTIEGHLAGVETQPWMRRAEPRGKQLPLGKSGAFQPTDPAMHTLRQANPHLNDYSFRMHANPGGYHHIQAIHTPTGTEAGGFTWKSKDYVEKKEQRPEAAGEVEMVSVKDQHAGRGLATAMWDYATFHGSREGSSVDVPKHSEIRSIEGNHWAHFVGGATMARTAGFGVQRYE